MKSLLRWHLYINYGNDSLTVNINSVIDLVYTCKLKLYKRIKCKKILKTNKLFIYIVEVNDDDGHISCKFINLPFASFFFFFSFSGWGETESTWYVGQSWPIVPAPDDR
jgi:hypothetical protein